LTTKEEKFTQTAERKEEQKESKTPAPVLFIWKKETRGGKQTRRDEITPCLSPKREERESSER